MPGVRQKRIMAIITVLIIGALSLIPVYFLVKDRFLRKGFDFDFSFKNLTIIPILSPNQRINNKIAICIYALNIVNKNTFDTTIKRIELFVKHNNRTLKTHLYNVATGKLSNGDNAVILNNGIDNIILMKWVNINQKIIAKDILSSGGILNGSAVFIIEEQTINPKDVSEVKVVIYDYLENKSSKTLDIDQSVFKGLDKNFKIIDRKFLQNDNNDIQFSDENV